MKFLKLKFSPFKPLQKIIKKRFGKLSISKRQQFVIAVGLLTVGLVVTQLSHSEFDYRTVIGLSVFTYIVSGIALRENLHGIEFFSLLVLPTLFTLAVSLFYFLLPSRLLTQLPIVVLYAIGMYALLLTENIYNVAVERSIQLLRAAQSVGFLLTLISVFFLIESILSLHQGPLINAGLSFIVLFPLSLQSLWSMELGARFTQEVVRGACIISLVGAEIALVLSFWPVRTTIGALFITTLFYTLVGMTQQYLVGRLFAKTQREFLGVLAIVFILVLLTTQWGSGGYLQ